jgi:hypothetical protein
MAHGIALSPNTLNNWADERVCFHHEKGKTGKESSNGSFVCVNKEEDSIKVGKSNTVIEKHVKGGVFAFAPSGTVLETWTEAEHKDGKR